MPQVLTRWLIYGAYGYTAKLIVEEAVKRGHQPIIAGRDEQKLLDLAELFDLEYKVFDLSHTQKVRQALRDVDVVLHCAGPYSETAAVMRRACIDEGVHYLDITGEIAVLEQSYACHEQARKQGVVIVSGVGFDVVATDVLALLLKEALPSARTLSLAFSGTGGMSPGTAKTLLRMLPEKGQIRRDGEIVSVPLAWQARTVQFADQPRFCSAIPWGDIATAFYSTGIKNIVVYTATDPRQHRLMKCFNPLVFLLAWAPIRRYLDKVITQKVEGPDEQLRGSSMMQLAGTVTDGDRQVSMQMQTPEGYSFTVNAALLALESVLAHRIMPGAYTPSQVLDIDAICAMEGVTITTAEMNLFSE